MYLYKGRKTNKARGVCVRHVCLMLEGQNEQKSYWFPANPIQKIFFSPFSTFFFINYFRKIKKNCSVSSVLCFFPHTQSAADFTLSLIAIVTEINLNRCNLSLNSLCVSLGRRIIFIIFLLLFFLFSIFSFYFFVVVSFGQ